MSFTATRWTRRGFIAASLPWLAACTTPLPLVVPNDPPDDASARSLLHDSANVHGLAAYRGLHDINISYAGQWRPLIGRIQPAIVDAGYRGGSQERLLPREGTTAQLYRGPVGEKKVLWRRGAGVGEQADALGRVAVWRNGDPVADEASLRAAALVAEAYSLFLLGPLWLLERGTTFRSGGAEQVDGRTCDVVEASVRPGLGLVAFDRVAVCIDRADRVARRVRFTLEGTENSAGAVAEVDTFEHERRFGVLWPMRSHERVAHPFRLPAHDWRITGLDVDRGYGLADLAGPRLTGLAAAAARPV